MAPQRAGRDITKQMLRHRQMVLDQMDFKQKAEEKKMSMSKNIARLAVTAGLTAALSFGGVMAPVTMAFADDVASTTTNSITINKNADNGNVQYKAYQIFKADVVDGTDGSGKVVSNIDWASTQARDAVLGYLSTVTDSGITTSSSAQEAAKYLTDHADGIGKTTPIENNNLFNGLAKAVVKGVEQTGSSFTAGNVFKPQDGSGNALQGYYLFVTDGSTLGTDQKPEKNTGTSPIFAVVGDALVTVNEKTSIPTVVKKVKNDDGSSDWADKADSQMGQKVDYKLTGSVASNIATFDSYYYEFSDKLSDGLTADGSSVVVKIGNTILSPNTTPGAKTGYDVSTDNATNTLTVKFADLKAAAKHVNVTLDGSSNVVVTYTAQLDSAKAEKVVVGDTGNENTVKLIYSNNPMGDGKGESVPDTVRDYTYALKLVKEDAADETTKLDGVKFTIQATDPDDTSSKDMYVNDKGILVNDPYEFETKNGGVIEVKGLDAGTYTVKETHTLGGYNTLPDFTFKISTADGDLAKPEGEGNNTLTVSVTKDTSSLVKDATVNKGVVNLTVQNKKGSSLPLTGLNGVTFTWIAGGAVLCIGVAHLIRSRKQAEESEQE